VFPAAHSPAAANGVAKRTLLIDRNLDPFGRHVAESNRSPIVQPIAFHEKHRGPASFARSGVSQTVQGLAERRRRIQCPNGLGQTGSIGQFAVEAVGLFSRRVEVLLTLSANILESPTRVFECPLGCLLPRFRFPALRFGLELSRLRIVLACLGLSFTSLDVAVALFGIARCRFARFDQLLLGRLRRFSSCALRLGRKPIALLSSSPHQFFATGHESCVDLPLKGVECSVEPVIDLIVERRHLRNYTAEPKGLMGLRLRTSWPSVDQRKI
jgi:hypothetical protein